MKKNLLIIYPFKFRNYDYERFEFNYLKKNFNIYIFDLIGVIYPHFIKAYKKENKIKNLYKINSLGEFKLSFLGLLNKKKKEKTFILNFNKSINLKSFIINTIINKTSIKKFGFYNPGNYFWSVNTLNFKQKFFFKFKQYFFDHKKNWWAIKEKVFFFLDKIYNDKVEHTFIAGNKFGHKNENSTYINSWDYSRLLCKKKTNKRLNHKIITFLDSPGPKFKSDSYLLKKKNDETSSNTYPALINLFNQLEEIFGLDVIIAAHPKTKHKKRPDYFGKRIVYSDKTLELIQSSKFVITRNSSSITYALNEDIPIIFIYTDEILKNKNSNYYNILGLANELGTKAINININYSEQYLRNLLKVKSKLNHKFKMNYFSNLKKPVPNHRIIYKTLLKEL